MNPEQDGIEIGVTKHEQDVYYVIKVKDMHVEHFNQVNGVIARVTFTNSPYSHHHYNTKSESSAREVASKIENAIVLRVTDTHISTRVTEELK